MGDRLKRCHSLCLVDNDDLILRNTLYNAVEQYLVENVAVVYAAEPDPTKVAIAMKKQNIEVEHYVETGALKILENGHPPFEPASKAKIEGRNPQNITKWLDSISSHRNGFGGMLILCAPTVTDGLWDESFDVLIDREVMMGRNFDRPLEVVCCYDRKLVSGFSIEKLIRIINCHSFSIHSRWVYRQWESERIIDLVGKGLDDSLGKGTANLFLKTLKYVYNFDDNSIMEHPEEFEKMLTRMCGNGSERVLRRILEKTMGRLQFNL